MIFRGTPLIAKPLNVTMKVTVTLASAHLQIKWQIEWIDHENNHDTYNEYEHVYDHDNQHNQDQDQNNYFDNKQEYDPSGALGCVESIREL